MSPERPSSIPPRSHPSQEIAKQEARKVEKLSEVDEDARKKRKFRMAMGDEDLLSDVDADKKPGPLEPGFYASTAPSSAEEDFDDVQDAIVASPSYSSPPDVSNLPAEMEDDDEDSLPQSNSFWESVDSPPDQPPQPLQMQETAQSEGRGFPKSPEKAQMKKEIHEKNGKEKSSKKDKPFHPEASNKPNIKPEKAAKPPFFTSSRQEPEVKPAQKQTAKEKPVSPFEIERRQAEIRKEKTQPAHETVRSSFHTEPKIEEQKVFGKKEKPHAKKEEIAASPTGDGQGIAPPPSRESNQGRQHQNRGGKTQEITPPSLSSLPPAAQVFAQTAATQASPYLRPAALSLYLQMVGTMHIMEGPKGVNRTEVLLNNPAFADSKFFGSKITIEKYTTAPDSFNIRLTGNDEAVVAFKENIPSLMSAFKNGHYRFRVHRVDVEYGTEEEEEKK